MFLLVVLPPVLPLLFIALARRRWPMWNELRLTAPAVVVWLMSVLPVCFVVTIGLAESSVIGQPYSVVRAAEVSDTAVPGDYPLRLSYYNPALGGTNCDSDCSTMASGDKTASWVGGRPSVGSGTVYAAACPREWGWHHGTRFTVAGLNFECRDTGGWINCYSPGETDKAIANAHRQGYLLDQPAVAQRNYCWVDLMTPMSVASYGALASDWYLE